MAMKGKYIRARWKSDAKRDQSGRRELVNRLGIPTLSERFLRPLFRMAKNLDDARFVRPGRKRNGLTNTCRVGIRSTECQHQNKYHISNQAPHCIIPTQYAYSNIQQSARMSSKLMSRDGRPSKIAPPRFRGLDCDSWAIRFHSASNTEGTRRVRLTRRECSAPHDELCSKGIVRVPRAAAPRQAQGPVRLRAKRGGVEGLDG
jgi:hypothetical protein